MRRALALAVVVLGLMRVDCLAAEKRAITEKDLFRFTWVADPQMSPDGSRVAFVQVVVNEAKDRYESSIWSVSTRGDEPPQRLLRTPLS
jgi:dipeptidyl aminopeptidase/acylaminoacyl peptidase